MTGGDVGGWAAVDPIVGVAWYGFAVGDSGLDRPPRSENSNGIVDTTRIDEMLRLSPEERLKLNDRLIATIKDLRESYERQNGEQ